LVAVFEYYTKTKLDYDVVILSSVEAGILIGVVTAILVAWFLVPYQKRIIISKHAALEEEEDPGNPEEVNFEELEMSSPPSRSSAVLDPVSPRFS